MYPKYLYYDYDYTGLSHYGLDGGYCIIHAGYCWIHYSDYLDYFDYVASGSEVHHILGKRDIANGPEAYDLLGRRDTMGFVMNHRNITAVGIATFREQAPLMGELVNTSVILSESSFGAILTGQSMHLYTGIPSLRLQLRCGRGGVFACVLSAIRYVCLCACARAGGGRNQSAQGLARE